MVALRLRRLADTQAPVALKGHYSLAAPILATMVDLTTILDQVRVLWVLIVGFVLTFLLSFSIGTNSIANIFGTSIGSKVLSHFQAVVLSSIFMALGAVVMGPAVANTISNNIVDIRLYKLDPELLMLGQISIILASALWTIVATFLKIPVAATHTVIGAIVGCNIMEVGIEGIQWDSLIYIGMSWVVSPLLSGVLALVIYSIVWATIVEKENPLESGARTLPLWFGAVVFINMLSVQLQLASLFEGFLLPWYLSVVNSFVCGVMAAILIWYCLVPRLKDGNEIESHALLDKRKETPLLDNNMNADPDTKQKRDEHTEDTHTIQAFAVLESKVEHTEELEGKYFPNNADVARLCSPLLVVSVIFSAFAYGPILVSVSVAPLITLWDVYETRGVTYVIENPFWMFLYGSFALTLGFAVLGGRVTETVGEGIAELSPSSAFPIELGTTLVFLVASNLGIPISSSQSKIGAIAAVGCYSDGGVDFKMLWEIFLAWVITLPVTTGTSAGLMALFQLTYQYTCAGDFLFNCTIHH